MNKQYKILTMCAGGNVRSVAMKHLLKYKYGHESLACGQDSNSLETREMLYKWADYIIPMTQEYAKFVPIEYSDKVFVYDVGPDRFGYAFHPELIGAVDKMIVSHGLFDKLEIRS